MRVTYHILRVMHCSRQKVKQDEFSVTWLRRVACSAFVILVGQAVVENYTRAGRKLERRSFPITFRLSVCIFQGFKHETWFAFDKVI